MNKIEMNTGSRGLIRRIALLALMVGAIPLVGCEDDNVPQVEPEVVNVTDNFHFRVEDARNVDTTITYWWPIEGSSANIDQNSVIQSGRVGVVIRDATQASTSPPLYQSDLRENGSFASLAGAPGAWRITFTLSGFSGLIDFRAQRR